MIQQMAAGGQIFAFRLFSGMPGAESGCMGGFFSGAYG
jgi:hypothetical protein